MQSSYLTWVVTRRPNRRSFPFRNSLTRRSVCPVAAPVAPGEREFEFPRVAPQLPPAGHRYQPKDQMRTFNHRRPAAWALGLGLGLITTFLYFVVPVWVQTLLKNLLGLAPMLAL